MKPLNPIMAALVIASVGALPLRAHAVGGSKPVAVPVGVPVAVAPEDTDSLTRLTEILSKKTEYPTAVADAGQRIVDFLLKPAPDKKSFVSTTVNAKALEETTRAWVAKQTPGDLARLYFVAGTGPTAPKWVKDDTLLAKTVLPAREAEGRLRLALARFTDAAQITAKGEKEATTAFLDTAVIEAKKVFDDPRPKPAVDASVGQNNNTGIPVPDTTRSAGSPLTASQYSLDDMYVTGAKVVDVSGPGDKSSRKISMKLYSKRMDDGTIINEIGIFDITDRPNGIYGQRFSLGGGDQAFALDDRTPGKKKYELKFGNDPDGTPSITFKRPGDGGNPLVTTAGELYLNRADQAAAMRNVVVVNGQEFYAIPQGGEKSALALFPKAMIDARSKENARDLTPALYAEVGVRGYDGRNENVKPGTGGGPQLGSVGGKDYHLEFNNTLKVWEVKEGYGNPTNPPKEPAKPVAGAGAGTTRPTTNADGSTVVNDSSITDMENLLAASKACKKDPDDTALMADDLKGQFGVLTCNMTGKPEDQQVILLVPNTIQPNRQMIFPSIAANPATGAAAATLLRGRIVDRYLVLQFDAQVHYLSLDKPKGASFELEGFVAGKSAGGPPPAKQGDPSTGMTNMAIFIDALRKYMDVPASSGVFAKVPERVEKTLGKGTAFSVYASYSNGDLIVNAWGNNRPTFQVWPNYNEAPADTAGGKWSTLNGVANAMEREVSSVDAPFEEKFDIPNSYQLVLEAKQKDIALYKTIDPTGKDKTEKYYLSFKYFALDTDAAKTKTIFRQKYFEVFNADRPIPAKREMQGLTDVKDPIVRGQLAYRFVNGTNDSRGVFAAFQELQLSENQKDPAKNCIGPLIWWGLESRDAALKVCKDDKF